MPKKVFIRVVGFTNVERHALNTVFRLSQDDPHRSHAYEPWLPGSSEPASMALIDGASGGASQELADMHANPDIGLIWVGAVTPAKAWRSFTRPLRWPAVLTAIDMYFEPAGSLDFDLGSETLPAQIDAASGPVPLMGLIPPPTEHCALLADPDPQARLFMRSLLAAMGITQVDEAASVAEAKTLLAGQIYQFACVDLSLSDLDPWLAIAQTRGAKVRLVTGLSISLTDKISAKINGCITMQKPLQSNKLGQLLRNL
jgi:CheY-like chemotaxis protein